MNTLIHDLFSVSKLEEHLHNGLISARKHPTLPLTIYNYTPKVMYDKVWDEVTTRCRGLIVDDNGAIVARGFDKFFGLETSFWPDSQLKNLPYSPPSITQKLDGSLGILWYYGGSHGIATRGSFVSDQAVWATDKWLADHEYGYAVISPLEGYTPIFEIIYKANRIVVDYDFEGLVLLALINNQTGEELERSKLEEWGQDNSIAVVTQFQFSVNLDLTNLPVRDKEEGYVLSWPRPGQAPWKVKIKFEEYVRLHRILTHLSAKDVWEMLKDDKGAADALLNDKTLPFSFRVWLDELVGDLERKYNNFNKDSVYFFGAGFDMLGVEFPPFPVTVTREQRKTLAQFWVASSRSLCSVLFAMLDGYDYKKVLWDMVKPSGKKVFVEDTVDEV